MGTQRVSVRRMRLTRDPGRSLVATCVEWQRGCPTTAMSLDLTMAKFELNAMTEDTGKADLAANTQGRQVLLARAIAAAVTMKSVKSELWELQDKVGKESRKEVETWVEAIEGRKAQLETMFAVRQVAEAGELLLSSGLKTSESAVVSAQQQDLDGRWEHVRQAAVGHTKAVSAAFLVTRVSLFLWRIAKVQAGQANVEFGQLQMLVDEAMKRTKKIRRRTTTRRMTAFLLVLVERREEERSRRVVALELLEKTALA